MRIISRGDAGEPKRIVCDSCGSELEYEPIDVYYGSDGSFVDCPVCGKYVCVNEKGKYHIPIYPNNGDEDFYFFADGVDVKDDEINRWIHETCTIYRDASEDERKRFVRIHSTGNAIMIAIGYEDPDEPLTIYVSKDYAEAGYYIDR